jgi:hypothetical protein
MTKPDPAKASVKRVALSERLPFHKLIRHERFASSTRTEVEFSKIKEIASLIWMPESLPDGEREALILKAIDVFESFDPSDGVEGMLAMQMVGTHNAIVKCFRRAMIPDQSLEAQKVYLSQAERLMSLYARHLDALARCRGKGQSNITVRHTTMCGRGYPGHHRALR